MLESALRWSTLASGLGIVTQIVILAALSRLLDATEFGLMAAAALAVRFISYFARAGLGEALIQRRDLRPAHCSAALISATLIGLTLWGMLALLAGLMVEYFRSPALRPVLLVAPFSILLASIASIPLSLLRREFRFKGLAFSETAGQIAGYGLVSISLAAMGYGVWSLVAATIAQQLIVLAVSLFVIRRLPWERPTRQDFAEILNYGSKYSVVSFLDFLSSNIETLFIGRNLGMASLGVYNRVAALTSVPIEHVLNAAQRVAFPAMARLTADRSRLGAAMALSLTLITLITLPAAFAIATMAEVLVVTVLGQAWFGAVPVVQVFAWAIPALHISVVTGSALDLLGAFRAKVAAIVAITILKVALIISVGGFGLVWVAAAMVIAEWTRAIVFAAFACRRLEVNILATGARLVFGLVIGCATGGAILLASAGLSGLSNSTVANGLVLAIQMSVAALVFALGVRIMLKRILLLDAFSVLDLAPLRRMARI